MKNIIKKFGALSLALLVALTMSSVVFADDLIDDGAATEPLALDSAGALQIALLDAGLDESLVKRVEVELDNDNNAFEIEFVKKSNRTEYEYEIAAESGLILEKSVDRAIKHKKSKKKIGKTKARKIVANASGVSITDIKKGTCKYKYKNKRGKYELKFKSGEYRYEYELIAQSGKILEYEYEYIGTR